MHGVVQNNNLICYVCASNCILLRTFVLRFILSPACVHCVGVSSYVVCLHVTCYCRSNKQAFDARDNLKRLMEQMKIELTTSHGDCRNQKGDGECNINSQSLCWLLLQCRSHALQAVQNSKA